MVAKNDITGDSIQTKAPTDLYRQNYDLIFRKKEDKKEEQQKAEFAEEEKPSEN